ncbi:MAG TPA: DUF488 domain-containing protein [Steroidobacteraceae bacterium]|jgi:uncharacterized protein (DUF488 family)|nr:DUF488 domain-containing protein [Steroidobacteraceae bacterium]
MSKTVRLSGLATVGYERVSLPAFLDTLKAAGVTLLLDVRELPISRRKGFSKGSLSRALSKAGIHYRHERALGAPRRIRHRLREDGDLKRYFADFRAYLKTQDKLLDTLAGSLSGCVALLCFERNPAECHRSLVAAALARRTRRAVEHLQIPL